MSFVPTIQLVDAPDRNATVLYDLHVDPEQFVSGSATWGQPTWTAAPGSVGGRDEYRQVQLTHYFDGSRADAFNQLNRLAQVLLRSECYLLVQQSRNSAPRWFHVWRSNPADLSSDNVYLSDGGGKMVGLYAINLTLQADPYLFGELEKIPTISINNDPAAGSNALQFELPEIHGDAPAPLMASVSGSTSIQPGISMLTVAPVPDGVGTSFVPIGTGDGCTAGTDCSAPISDAAFSGGSYRQVTFATSNGLVQRLQGALPTLQPGLYRVLMRATLGLGNAGVQLNLGRSSAVPDTVGPQISYAVGTSAMDKTCWIDLGEYSWPSQHDQTKPAGTLAGFWSLFLSGTAAVNLDALAFVPSQMSSVLEYAPETACKFGPVVFGGSAGAVLLDGESQWITGQPIGNGVAPGVAGSFPVVTPAQTNLLTYFSQLGSTEFVTASDSIATVTDLDLSYHPRYLWPAP